MNANDWPELDPAVVQRLAKLARIPNEERERYGDLIGMPIALAWKLDLETNKPSRAMERAADSVRTLWTALAAMDGNDKDRLQLWDFDPRAFLKTIENGQRLLSIAAGKSPLPSTLGDAKQLQRPGTKPDTVQDVAFCEFLRWLLTITEECCGGKLTLSNTGSPSGTLMETLDILREYTPSGFIPAAAPQGVIRNIRRTYREPRYVGSPPINFYASPE
jgi:hypothetical protein